MRIVDAVWEKRNLGVDTVEIALDEDDDVNVFEEINTLKQPYQVLKIPNGRIDISSAAQKNGFYLIETQLNLISRFSEPNFSPLVKRFLDSINFEDANDVETELVLSEIASGEIFKTDRIALDPHFGCKIAGVRYANWIRDTLNCSGHLLVAKKNGALSGFVSVALKDDYADAILGGALSSNRIPSIGVMCSYAGVTFARETGAKYVITSVSSNNIPAMKINLAAGYEIKDSLYVLVRHIS